VSKKRPLHRCRGLSSCLSRENQNPQALLIYSGQRQQMLQKLFISIGLLIVYALQSLIAKILSQ